MRTFFYCILFFKFSTPLPSNNNSAQFLTMVVGHDWAVGLYKGFVFVKYYDHLRKNVWYRRWTIRKIRPDAFIIRCLVYIIILVAWQLYWKRRRRKRISRQSAAYDNGRTNCDRLECVLRAQLSKSNIFADDRSYGEPSTTTDRYNIIIRYTRLCVCVRDRERERERLVRENEKSLNTKTETELWKQTPPPQTYPRWTGRRLLSLRSVYDRAHTDYRTRL